MCVFLWHIVIDINIGKYPNSYGVIISIIPPSPRKCPRLVITPLSSKKTDKYNSHMPCHYKSSKSNPSCTSDISVKSISGYISPLSPSFGVCHAFHLQYTACFNCIWSLFRTCDGNITENEKLTKRGPGLWKSRRTAQSSLQAEGQEIKWLCLTFRGSHVCLCFGISSEETPDYWV